MNNLKTTVTRTEFITLYAERFKPLLGEGDISEDGIRYGDLRMLALPCACGDDACQGWAMISEELADMHLQFYAPQEGAA